MNERAKTLLVYATTHGHTAKIAKRLAEAMRAEGAEVELSTVDGNPDPALFDAVVAGASIHVGMHQEAFDIWVTDNRDAIAARPNAFFSVSLTAAEDSSEARAHAAQVIDDFVRETGWKPDRCVPIAGALEYREYDPFTRLLMRLKMKHEGHPSETSRDYDYTDWDAVERLGRELATLAKQPEVAR